MIVSLDEIETRCRRAARGAGFAFGLAEEAGKASRRLAENGIAFEHIVSSVFSTPRAVVPPLFADGMLRPAEAHGALCPILAGAFLSDLGVFEARLLRVRAPVLLGPFFCAAGAPVKLSSGGVTVWVHGRSILVDGTVDGGSGVTARVTITQGVEIKALSEPAPRPGILVDDEAWEALLALEMKTYVPASEESKVVGAGTGALTDND